MKIRRRAAYLRRMGQPLGAERAGKSLYINPLKAPIASASDCSAVLGLERGELYGKMARARRPSRRPAVARRITADQLQLLLKQPVATSTCATPRSATTPMGPWPSRARLGGL